jgi:hypothetical protein
MKDNVIHIRFSEDLSVGQPHPLGSLLNLLRYKMEMAQWRALNRAARPTEDPDTWDFKTLDRLDRAYEMIGMP